MASLEMKPHEIILKMIEEVDPADKDTMNEIDTRIWCWLNDIVFIKPKRVKNLRDDEYRIYGYRTSIGDISTWMIPPKKEDGGQWAFKYRVHFTTSRDALKMLRPYGWWSRGTILSHNGWQSELYNYENGKSVSTAKSFTGIQPSFYASTEELAELHAIIQAISFERENNETV